MNQCLHGLVHDAVDVPSVVALAVIAHAQLRGPADLRVVDHDRARTSSLEPVGNLADDAQRLHHLFESNTEPAVGVTGVPRRDFEVEVLVTEVGLGLAEVPRQPSRAKDRTCDAQRHATGEVQVSDPAKACLEDGVLVAELDVVGDALAHERVEVAYLLDAVEWQVAGDATWPDVSVVHPQTGDELEQVKHE